MACSALKSWRASAEKMPSVYYAGRDGCLNEKSSGSKLMSIRKDGGWDIWMFRIRKSEQNCWLWKTVNSRNEANGACVIHGVNGKKPQQKIRKAITESCSFACRKRVVEGVWVIKQEELMQIDTDHSVVCETRSWFRSVKDLAEQFPECADKASAMAEACALGRWLTKSKRNQKRSQ